jgi:hypothetical protein
MNILLLYDREESWQADFKKRLEEINPNWRVFIRRKIGDVEADKVFSAVFIHASNERQVRSHTDCCDFFLQSIAGRNTDGVSGVPAEYVRFGEAFRQQSGPKAAVVLSGELEVAHRLVGSIDAGYQAAGVPTDYVCGFLIDFNRTGKPDYDLLHGRSPREAALQALSALYPIALLWEARGGSKTEAVAELQTGARIVKLEFENSLRQYAFERIINPAQAKQVKSSLLNLKREWLEKLGRGSAEATLEKIDDLCDCDKLTCDCRNECQCECWTNKLNTLKSEWLSEILGGTL